MSKRRTFLKNVFSSIAAFPLHSLLITSPVESKGNKKTNILLIMADDLTYNNLELYGGKNVKTPNIDKLASEGITFNNAYLSMAMCNPCRTELYTGLYPARNGSCWNHSRARTGTKSIVHYLGRLGYRVGLAGKKHVGPLPSFKFDMVKGIDRRCVHVNPEFNINGVRDYITKDKSRPFCLVVAFTEPHAPWTIGKPKHFDQEKLDLPPYMADTKETRSDYAKYLAEIEVLDHKVGEIIKLLDENGLRDDTLVMFTSEQGGQWPGCKWTNWNTGIHTAFVARWPGKIKPGRRTDALIQYADVCPTLIDAAGGDFKKEDLDGSSFLKVLTGKSQGARKYAYFMHNNIPQGPPYPIRAVTDGKYHYIRNLKSDSLYIEKHVMGVTKWHEYWPSWVFDTAFNERSRMAVERYMRRPPEQFYRSDIDPNEMNNLADDKEHAEEKQRLSKELDKWMAGQGDPGAALDDEKVWRAAKKGKHFELKRKK